MKKKTQALMQEPAPQPTADHTKEASKKVRTLCCLLRGPRHRFDAERWGDHCLHSTVAALKREEGIDCDRRWAEVPNRFGSQTRVKQYWVASGCAEQAMRLVARHRHTLRS